MKKIDPAEYYRNIKQQDEDEFVEMAKTLIPPYEKLGYIFEFSDEGFINVWKGEEFLGEFTNWYHAWLKIKAHNKEKLIV